MSLSIFRPFGQTSSSPLARNNTRKRLPIHRGTYSFVNRQSGTAMEMTSDHTIVGMPPKDSDTQKWEVHPLGAGHSIRNLKYGKYLSVKSIAKDAMIVPSDFPVAWQVVDVHISEENAAFYEIHWPGTDFMFELADSGSSAPKTKVKSSVQPSEEEHATHTRDHHQIHISEGQFLTEQQRCRYWKANRIRQSSFYQPSPPTQNQGSGMGSGFFGFTDKWKSLAPEKRVQIAQPHQSGK